MRRALSSIVDQISKTKIANHHTCRFDGDFIEIFLATFLATKIQLSNKKLLKISKVNTCLHQGPVSNSYKPNNEKAKQKSFYRGAMAWNTLTHTADDRNREFTNFKTWIKGERFKIELFWTSHFLKFWHCIVLS